MKKLSLLMMALIAAIPLSRAATTATVDGLTYTLSTDGTAVATGCSDKTVTHLDIPSTVTYRTNTTETRTYTVTAIGEGAFQSLSDMTTLTLPSTIESIGRNAFHYCQSLESVEIPEKVTTLDWVFNYCSSLHEITIPATVTKFTSSMMECGAATSVIFADSDESIELDRNIFSYSTIDNLYIGRNITGEDACFSDKGINHLTIGDKVTEIRYREFYNNPLETLTLGKSVTKIGNNAFDGCTALKKLDMPDSVVDLGHFAFSSCTALSEIHISAGLKLLGYAFNGCTSLKDITIPATIEHIGQSFQSCGVIENFIIEDSDNELYIGDYVFNGTDIHTLYQGRDFTNTGYFLIGKGITTLTIGDKVKQVRDGEYRDNPIETLTLGKSITQIGNNAFDGCTALKKLDMPDSVVDLGHFAFNGCTALSEIHISAGLKLLGYAFNGCTSLKDITIPSTIEHIGQSFQSCGVIENLIIEDSDNELYIGDYVFNGTDIHTLYQGRDFTNTGYFLINKGITTLTIGDKVKQVRDGEYRDNPIETLTLGKSITQIGRYAFASCTALTKLDMPDSVVDLGHNAFNDCTALSDVHLSSGLKLLEFAFIGCTSLKDITIPATIEHIGESFKSCNIENFIIEDSNVAIDMSSNNFVNSNITNVYQGRNFSEDSNYWGFFNECCVTNVTIGDEVTRIREMSYLGINGNESPLKSIVIGKSVKEIGYRAFDDNPLVETVTVFAREVPDCENDNIFADEAYENALLLVPAGTRDAYASAKVWKNFKHIGQSTCAVTFKYDAEQCDLTLPEGFTGEVPNGSDLTFTATARESFRLGNVTATGGFGSFDKAGDNTWTLTDITTDVTITIPTEEIYFTAKATMTEGAGTVSLNSVTSGTCSVRYGQPLDIAVNLNEGYKLDALTVNGTDAMGKLTDNHMTISAVLEDITVSAQASLLTYTINTDYDNEYGTVTLDGNTSDVQTFTYGSTPTLKIEAAIGYRTSTVTLNGQDITSQIVDNSYTLAPVKSDIKIAVTFEERTVDLSILGLEGGRVAAVYGYGATAKIRITPAEGWKVNTVTFNGQPVDNADIVNGVFTTPVLTDDSEVSVTFSQNQDPGRTEMASADNVRVYGRDRVIYIQGAEAAAIASVADTSGREIYRGTDREIPVGVSGVYIVYVAGQAYKLML